MSEPHTLPLILFCGWVDKSHKSSILSMYTRRYLVLTNSSLHWFEAPLGVAESRYAADEKQPVLFGNHKGSLRLDCIDGITFSEGVVTVEGQMEGKRNVYELKDSDGGSKGSPSAKAWFDTLTAAYNNIGAGESVGVPVRGRHASVSGSYVPTIPAISLVTSSNDAVVVFKNPVIGSNTQNNVFYKSGTQLGKDIKVYLADGTQIVVGPIKAGTNEATHRHPLLGDLVVTICYVPSGVNLPAGGTMLAILCLIIYLSIPIQHNGVSYIAFPNQFFTYFLTGLFSLIMFKDRSLSDFSQARFTFELTTKHVDPPVRKDSKSVGAQARAASKSRASSKGSSGSDAPEVAPTLSPERSLSRSRAVTEDERSCIHFASLKFAKCFDAEKNEIKVAELLVACEAFLEILRAMGSSMMLAVKDFQNNIKKAHMMFDVDQDKYSTMKALLEAEKKTGIHQPGGINKDPSSAAGLLWIRRSLSYQLVIFQELIKGDEVTLQSATQISYDQELLPFHAWMLKTVFGRVIASVPTRENLEKALLPKTDDADLRKNVSDKDMKEFVDLVGPVLEQWRAVYAELDLEDVRKV